MEKITAVVLLEKFYCRIFSGKNFTAVVLLEKFYCRIFSGKILLLKSSCWKICLKIFSGFFLLQNLEWKEITAEDFLLENLPAKIKIHEYFEASISHVART